MRMMYCPNGSNLLSSFRCRHVKLPLNIERVDDHSNAIRKLSIVIHSNSILVLPKVRDSMVAFAFPVAPAFRLIRKLSNDKSIFVRSRVVALAFLPANAIVFSPIENVEEVHENIRCFCFRVEFIAIEVHLFE